MLDRVRQRPAVVLAVSAVVVAALVAGLAIGYAAINYRDSVDDAARTAGNLSLVMADQVDQAVAATDQTLAGIAEALRVGGLTPLNGDTIDRLIQGRPTTNHFDAFETVVIVDAAGQVLHWSGDRTMIGRDVSRCAFFAEPASRADIALSITVPDRGCTAGRFVLPFSMRVVSPTGEFTGVVASLVDPMQLLRGFRVLDIGPSGTASLWMTDGMLVARSAGDPAAIGRRFQVGPLYQGLQADVRSATLQTVSPIDGVTRMLSWRIVHDHPLVVTVALGAPDYLARWRRETMTTAVVGVVTIVIIAVLAALLARQLGRAERASRSLRESERRFRDFAAASADWYWEQDEELRFVSAMPSSSVNTAMLPQEYVGQTRREVGMLGVSEEQWRQHDADLAARRPLRNFTFQRIDGTGRLRHFSISGVPTYDEAGNFRGYRGTGRDITAEFEAAQTLRAVIDAIPGIINAKDVDGRYVLMNVYQARLYGTTPEQAIGKTAADLLGAEYGAYTAGRDQAVVASGESTGFYEERYTDAAGVTHDWLTAKLPVKDPRGQVRLVISVSTEITERKHAEQKVLRAQEALLEAKEAAERANRAKSQFLANMSHELRTPLNAVIGFSEVMMNELFGPMGTPRYREYARDIHRSGSHLLDLINDILDMAKIEVGRRELNPEPIDLAAEIDETMRLIQWRVGGGVTLRTELADAPASAAFDRRALRQILLNLVGNAVKFTPAGGSVTLSVQRPPEGLALVIADTGIGIAKEHLAHLGTPFYQAHSADVAGKEGTGLGLALTKALVELHGGRLVIDSELGVGTTVTALFPNMAPSPVEADKRSAA